MRSGRRTGLQGLDNEQVSALLGPLGEVVAARGDQEFARDLAMMWVDEPCDFFAKEQASTLKPTDPYLFRVVQMLGDFRVHGAALRRYSHSISRVTRHEADTIARVQGSLRSADPATSTVRTYGTIIGEILALLDTRGGLARRDATAIGSLSPH